MSVHLIPAAEAMAKLDQFDAILDARSEGEHAEDHLPGALSSVSYTHLRAHET